MYRLGKGRPRARKRVCFLSRRLIAIFGVATFLSSMSRAQDVPEVPSPTVPPTPPIATGEPLSREEQLEERLRRMEEMNRALLERFDSMAEKNAELSETVEDLSKRLDEANAKAESDGDGSAAGGGGSGAGAGSIEDQEPITGGLSTPTDKPAAKKKRLPLKGYVDQDYAQRYGFLFETDDEEFSLRVNGLIQADMRFYEQGNQYPVVQDFDMPRARLYFGGRLTKPIEYQVSFQRTTNNFDLLNAYLNLRPDPRLQFRAGRFRVPYTYEWAKLSNWELPTLDRAPFAQNFGANRMIGFMGWGNLFENRLEYAVGVFDGPRNSYHDFNSSKDIVAFTDIRPFFEKDSESVLKNLTFGGSLDAGRQNNPPVPNLLRTSNNSSALALTAFSGDAIIAAPFLALNSNVRERGDRTLWEVHSTYFYKSLLLWGAIEWGNNNYGLVSNNPEQPPAIHIPVSGFNITSSYLLTGEEREKLELVEPLKPFSLKPGKFGPGAWEAVARYSQISVGNQIFTQGLADPNLWTNEARVMDTGFNWYPNKYLRFGFDWQHAMYADPVYYRPGGFQKTSDLFWMRFQLYF